MQITTTDAYLDITLSETDALRQQAEGWSREYAVMRGALVGGHGTTMTFLDGRRVRLEPANGDVQAVKAAIDAEYRKAMTANVQFLRERQTTGAR